MSAEVCYSGSDFIELNLRAEDSPGYRNSMLEFKKTDKCLVLIKKVAKVWRAEAGVCRVTPLVHL
jgi:hypothetical protein